MAALTMIIIFLITAAVSFVILEIASLYFWLAMLIDALKKKDTMWIALLIVGFLTGALCGLLAVLYYELMYRDEQGHRKSNRAFVILVISTIVFFIVLIILLIMLINETGNLLNAFYSQFMLPS